MRIGFDYWQVISHYPDQFREIIESFVTSGHEVIVLSAVGAQQSGTVQQKVRNFGIGVPVYEVLFEHTSQAPELKLAKCKELGIELFFDDREDVCDALNDEGILALRVPRRVVGESDDEAEIGNGS